MPHRGRPASLSIEPVITHEGTLLNINGFNLNLEKMTNDDIKITGKIESIEIERTEE